MTTIIARVISRRDTKNVNKMFQKSVITMATKLPGNTNRKCKQNDPKFFDKYTTSVARSDMTENGCKRSKILY